MDNHAPPALPRQASIVFIRIQDFARRPVGEQAELRDRLERLVDEATSLLPVDGRIVLDALDGTAIVIPQRPELALDVADAAQKSAADLPFSIGINYGAIKAVSSTATADDADAALVGDGLDTARAVAEFAKPGRYLTTRTFREVLKKRTPDRVHALGPSGTFTDLRLRTHELFVSDKRFARRRRRKLFTTGVMGVILILTLGIAARMNRQPSPASVPGPVQLATIVFDIKPQAEVMLDGIVKGKTPPLTQLETSPGVHTLRITHGKFPPIELELELDEGEKATVRHVFAAGQKPPAPPRQRTYLEKLDKLRQKWGL